jgi:hypothetical protein
MAQNLSTSNYTLAAFKAFVRAQTGAMSQQESGLLELQLNDIVHNAIVFVRSILGRAIDGFYNTEQVLGSITFSSGWGSITIATYSIADINKIRIFDPTLKEIPVLSYTKFNALRSVYSSSDISSTHAIATVAASSGTPNVLKIEFFSASGTITTATLYYPRNPVKVTTDTDTLDLPDHLIPIAQDVATVSVFKKLKKEPPADANQNVMSFVQGQIQQLGYKVSPQNE